MKVIELDGQEMKSKLITHCYLKEKLDSPEYVGGNLDALWDVLSSLVLPTTIILDHRKELIDQLGAYGDRLVDVFCEAALENESLWVEIK